MAMLSTGERFDCVTIPDPRGPFLFFFLPRRAVDGILLATSRQQSVIALHDSLFSGCKLTTTKTLKKSSTCRVAIRVGSSQQTPFSALLQTKLLSFERVLFFSFPVGIFLYLERESPKKICTHPCAHTWTSLCKTYPPTPSLLQQKREARRKIKIAI